MDLIAKTDKEGTMIKQYPLVALAWLGTAISLIITLYLIYESDAATSWITVPGVVTAVTRATQGETNNGDRMGYRGKTEYMTVTTKRVAYRYYVGERQYRGLAFSSDVMNLQRGMRLDVRYDPERPEQSRLEVETPWHLVLMWLTWISSDQI